MVDACNTLNASDEGEDGSGWSFSASRTAAVDGAKVTIRLPPGGLLLRKAPLCGAANVNGKHVCKEPIIAALDTYNTPPMRAVSPTERRAAGGGFT